MGNKYASFKELMFADYEHPTSFKLNQILNLMEDTRLANGPYSISLDAQFELSFRIRMNEDLKKIGGVVHSTAGTLRQFNIYYATKETASGDYACWENQNFNLVNGDLVCTLNSGSNVYENEVDVSAIQENGLYCLRASGN